MDKILSAEEWIIENGSFYEDNIGMLQDYSTYLLEAFAEEVKSKAKIQFCNDGNGCGMPYCDIPCQQIDKQSIDQLLTKFKEKL